MKIYQKKKNFPSQHSFYEFISPEKTFLVKEILFQKWLVQETISKNYALQKYSVKNFFIRGEKNFIFW